VILLLAADYQDARRWDDATQLDEDAILIVEPGDVHACAKRITPGARIIVTDRCSPSQGLISALQALHARIGLVDPTGLLGPLDPDRRLPATKGPIRYYHGE
jgi:hypothetical protein